MIAQPDLRHDRVREHTAPEANQQIDDQITRNLRLYASADKEVISQRLEELDKEWDIERTLGSMASSVILGGLLLGFLSNRKWLALPLAASGFLLQHSVQGWCPPMTVLRRRGVRTRKEIERERFGLKLLRGDFDSFHSGEKPGIERVLSLIDESKFPTSSQIPV